jgi:hypothetical protein
VAESSFQSLEDGKREVNSLLPAKRSEPWAIAEGSRNAQYYFAVRKFKR